MMHQLPTTRFVRHLLFWVSILVVQGLMTIVNPRFCFCNLTDFLNSLLFASLPTFLVHTYVLAYGLLPFVFRRQFGWFVGGLLLLNLFSWFLYDLLLYGSQHNSMDWFGQKLPVNVATWLANSPFPGNNFWNINLAAGLFICLKLFGRWQRTKAESQRLEREKLTQELKLVKLQLSPAFLLGSLSTLHHLAQQQAKQAPEVLLRLAYFLRYILYESQVDTVSLNQEIDAISDYVFLQKTIHFNLLEASFTFRGNSTNQVIAPLSLLTLIKTPFGQLPTELVEPTWVSIDMYISHTQLNLKVIHELTNEMNRQVTFDGLEKQLAFYYPGNHSLNVWRENQLTIITLTISLPTIDLDSTLIAPAN